MNKLIVLFCGMAAIGIADPGTLTLEQALELAQTHSPELRAARAELLATGETIRAAGRWTNPSLEFEAESLGGDYSGFDQGEYSLGILQEFPTSGKLGKAKAVARHSQSVAGQALRQVERDFSLRVRTAFIELQAQEELTAIQRKREKLAQEFFDAAAARHTAGGASELDTLQAEVQLEEAQLERNAAEQNLTGSRAALAGLVGVPSLGKPRGDFFQPLESLGVAEVDLSYPALMEFQALEAQTRAEGGLARSQGIPDLELGVGVRYEADSEVQSYLLGASIPIPVFRTGRRESAAALLRADAVALQRERMLRDLNLELTQRQVEYETAAAKASRYRETLLPKANKAYELSRAGYDSGRYSALELVIVQQRLATTHIRHIEAQRDALIARAQLNQLTSGDEL